MVLEIAKDPKAFVGWLALIIMPLVLLSACASLALVRDINKTEKRERRRARKAAKSVAKSAVAQESEVSGGKDDNGVKED